MQDQENGKLPLRLRWMELANPPFQPWCRMDVVLLDHL